MKEEKIEELRKDFPLLQKKIHGKPIIYLDNAATTQKPQAVIAAVKRYYEEENANVHRGVYALSQEATELYEGAHKVVGAFINAEPEEIIFTRGTTESINLLAYTIHSLIPDGKNEIVLTEMEHHSNLVPWQQFAKRHGFTLKYISLKEDYTLDYDDAKEKITDKTAVVAFTHISNALGTINDVSLLITLAKEKGALTVIDAAQSAAHLKIDVQEMGCDFLAFSAHKMLGPTGIGALYGRKELLENMEPFHYGGDMIRTVSFEDATWNKLPMKFEAGTPHIAGAVGFAEAIKYLQNVGMEEISKWEKELLAYALDKIKDVEGVEIYNAGVEKSAGIVSFTIKGVHPHDVASLLDDEGICVRGGHHCAMPLMSILGVVGTLRASFYLYTTLSDIDVFVTSLQRAKELLTKKVAA